MTNNFEIKLVNDTNDLKMLTQVYDDNSLDLQDESSYIHKIWKSSQEQNQYFIVGLINSKPAGYYAQDMCAGTYFLA